MFLFYFDFNHQLDVAHFVLLGAVFQSLVSDAIYCIELSRYKSVFQDEYFLILNTAIRVQVEYRAENSKCWFVCFSISPQPPPIPSSLPSLFLQIIIQLCGKQHISGFIFSCTFQFCLDGIYLVQFQEER